jgi:TIR domain
MTVIEPKRAIKIFFSYAHEDKDACKELEEHLSALKHSDKIEIWYDRDIQAGTSWAQEIDIRLNSADLILLFISRSFMNSDYCYGIEMKRAMEKHHAGTAHVIPIILSPVDLKDTPVSNLQALPNDAKPINKWPDRDEAFVNVVDGIRSVVETLLAQKKAADEAIAKRSRETIDTHEAVKRFHHLMQPENSRFEPSFRTFCLTGQAKIGKSHLLQKVFPDISQHTYHARQILIDLRDLPISSVTDVLNTICLQLGAHNCSTYSKSYQKMRNEAGSDVTSFLTDYSLVGSSAKASTTIQRQNNRLTTDLVIDLDRLHDKPIVFFFDSFDLANKQIQNWLITSFLAKVSALPHVRVVIAGRSLPEKLGDYVGIHQIHQLAPVREDTEYFTYCQNMQVNLDEIEIASAARSCKYTPGIFINYLFIKMRHQAVQNG